MKPFTRAIITSFALALIISIGNNTMAQKAQAGDVYPGYVAADAFTLSSTSKVKISGTGGIFSEDWRQLVFYGWILNSDTRQVAWHMLDGFRDDRRRPDYGLIEIDEEIELPAGTYELYYTGMVQNRNNDWRGDGFRDVMDNIFGSRGRDRFRGSLTDELFITALAPGMTRKDPKQVVDDYVGGAIMSAIRIGDEESFEQGFTINAETSIRVYAIGEGTRESVYDYVWIYDLEKNKRVWEMDYRSTDFAGGGDKNIVADEKITLPAGSYMVSYNSDDSHSYREWNVFPPDDPQMWGVTIWPETDADARNLVPFKKPEAAEPVVELVNVRDDEDVAQGFTLTKKTDLRVLSVGEEGSSRFVDSGWIVDANTRQTVWDMELARTEHAGGANKNRMADEVITLEPGQYIAYYSTDDSHSYRDWNAARPHMQNRWGITIWATNSNDRKSIELFDANEFKSAKAIVEITRVRDDEYLKESFTLNEDTRLRILALGEGTDGRMYDYGWIKNMDTGRVVWEMTYRNSDYAGGADKNREYNDVIILPAGNYRVYYETDGSHSYRDWNASPPRDAERYGISLLIE